MCACMLGREIYYIVQQGEKFITVPVKVMMLASQAMEGNLGKAVFFSILCVAKHWMGLNIGKHTGKMNRLELLNIGELATVC